MLTHLFSLTIYKYNLQSLYLLYMSLQKVNIYEN